MPSWKPIRKIAVQFATAVLVPAALAGLNAVDVTDIDWRVILTAAVGAGVTALIGYLTPFASNETYTRYRAP